MLDWNTILRPLGRLAELLRERDTEGELCLFGGTVMVVAFRARPSTRDVDAISHQPWVAWPGAALRATLLAESPAPFRERNLFVSANALSRA